MRIARGRGLSPQDAEDCVHEAMLRVVARADVDEERIGALLTTVVVNSAVDFHRRAKTSNRVMAKAAVILSTRNEGDPATAVCDRDFACWTARLVDHLPASQRQALMARADGQAVSDIAVDMSTSAKAVESLISRARAAARSAMASGLAAAVGFARRLKPFPTMAAAAATGAAVVVVALPTLHLTRPGPGVEHADPRSPRAPSVTELAANSQPASPMPAHHANRAPAAGTGGGTGDASPVSGQPGGTGHTVVGGQVTAPDGSTTAGGHVDYERRPSDKTFEEKVSECVQYGPTVGWRPETFPLPDEDPVCRSEPGSPLWR